MRLVVVTSDYEGAESVRKRDLEVTGMTVTIDLKLGEAQRFVREIRRVRPPAVEHLRLTPMSDLARERLIRFEEEFGGLEIELTSGLVIELSAVWGGRTEVVNTDWGHWDGDLPRDPPVEIEAAQIGTMGEGCPVSLNLDNGDVVVEPNMVVYYFPDAHDVRSWLWEGILGEACSDCRFKQKGFKSSGDRRGFEVVCAAAGVVPMHDSPVGRRSYVIERDLVGCCLDGRASISFRDDEYGRALIERLGDRVVGLRLDNVGRGFEPNPALLDWARKLPPRRVWELALPKRSLAFLELREHGPDWVLLQRLVDDREDEELVVSSRRRSRTRVQLRAPREDEDVPF